MAPPGADPFDDLIEDKGPTPFAVGFDKSTGDALVYGSLFVGALLVFISLAAGETLMALASLVPLGIAFWHYPMVERGTPQLGANADGLFVERIGFIDWAAVARIDLQRSSVRNIKLARLELSLHRPLKDAVAKPQVIPLWKTVMMRNWRLRRQKDGSEALVVQLHTLRGDPDDIIARIRAFRNV